MLTALFSEIIIRQVGYGVDLVYSRTDSEGCDNPMVTGHALSDTWIVAAFGRGWSEFFARPAGMPEGPAAPCAYATPDAPKVGDWCTVGPDGPRATVQATGLGRLGHKVYVYINDDHRQAFEYYYHVLYPCRII